MKLQPYVSSCTLGVEKEGPTSDESLGSARNSIDGGLALVHDDAVGQVGGHYEVVLHYEGRLLGVHNEPLYHLRGLAPDRVQATEHAGCIEKWWDHGSRLLFSQSHSVDIHI